MFVPAEHAAAATDAIAAALGEVVVGNAANPAVTMGPVVNMAQRKSVEEGIRRLAERAGCRTRTIVLRPWMRAASGACVPPTLLKLRNGAEGDIVHEMEVFGPVATVVPYRDKQDAFALAQRGGGSLARRCSAAMLRF